SIRSGGSRRAEGFSLSLPALFRLVCVVNLQRLRLVSLQVAICLAPGSLQHLPRGRAAWRIVSRCRLRDGVEFGLRALLLRQDNDLPVRLFADAVSRRPENYLSILSILAVAPVSQG